MGIGWKNLTHAAFFTREEVTADKLKKQKPVDRAAVAAKERIPLVDDSSIIKKRSTQHGGVSLTFTFFSAHILTRQGISTLFFGKGAFLRLQTRTTDERLPSLCLGDVS